MFLALSHKQKQLGSNPGGLKHLNPSSIQNKALPSI